MRKFILLAFIFFALGFYELSGGADFDPEAARLAAIEARQDSDAARRLAQPAPAPALPESSATPIRTQISENDTRTDTPPENRLQLASFAAVATGTTARQTAPQVVAPTPAPAPLSDLADAALEDDAPLSLAALEPAEQPNPVAFAGSSAVASSQQANTEIDIRAIKGTRVNIRSGPGTEYDVIDQLVQSTPVEVLTDSGNGWVELRPVDGGTRGWIAEFLLTRG